MISRQLFADAADFANSDSVQSFLRSASGAVITSTLIGAKESIDVNVANQISVSVDGLYDGVNNLTPDSVGFIAHARGATPDETSQTFRSTGGAASADNVVAADVHGLDVNSFGMLFDGTTWDRARGTAGAANVHIASQESGFIVAVKKSYAAAKVDTETVGVTAVQLAATPLAGRSKISVQNNSGKVIYIGFTSGVTAADGIVVPAKGFWEEEVDAAQDVYAIGSAAALDVRVAEYAA